MLVALHKMEVLYIFAVLQANITDTEQNIDKTNDA